MQGDGGIFRIPLSDSLVYSLLGSGASSEVVPTLKPWKHVPSVQPINNSCPSQQNPDASQNTGEMKVVANSSVSSPSSPTRSAPCNESNACSNSSSTSTSTAEMTTYKKKKESQKEEVERKRGIREAKVGSFWCQLEAHRQRRIKSTLFFHLLKNATLGCSRNSSGVSESRGTCPTKLEPSILCSYSPPSPLLEKGELSKKSSPPSATVNTTASPSFLSFPESSSSHSSEFSSPMAAVPLLWADDAHSDLLSPYALPSFPSSASENFRSFLLWQYIQYMSSLCHDVEDSASNSCTPPIFVSIVWPLLYMTCDKDSQTVELQCDQMERNIEETKEAVKEGKQRCHISFSQGEPSSSVDVSLPTTVKKTTYRLARIQGVDPLTLASCWSVEPKCNDVTRSQHVPSFFPHLDDTKTSKNNTHHMVSSSSSSHHACPEKCFTTVSSSSPSSAGRPFPPSDGHHSGGGGGGDGTCTAIPAAPSCGIPSSSFSSFIQPDCVMVRWEHHHTTPSHPPAEPIGSVVSEAGVGTAWHSDRKRDGLAEEETLVDFLHPSTTTASSSSSSTLPPNTVHITLIAVETLASRYAARREGLRWYAALCAAALEGHVEKKESEREGTKHVARAGTSARYPTSTSASSCSYATAIEAYARYYSRSHSTMSSLQGIMAFPPCSPSSTTRQTEKKEEVRKGDVSRHRDPDNSVEASTPVGMPLFFCVDAELRAYEESEEEEMEAEKEANNASPNAPPARPHVYRTVPVDVGVCDFAELEEREKSMRTTTCCTLSFPRHTFSPSSHSSRGGCRWWWWWWSTFAVLEWIQQILLPLLLFTFQILGPLRSSLTSSPPSPLPSLDTIGVASDEECHPSTTGDPLSAGACIEKEDSKTPCTTSLSSSSSSSSSSTVFAPTCSIQQWLASLLPWISFFHIREHFLRVVPVPPIEGPSMAFDSASTPEGMEDRHTVWPPTTSTTTTIATEHRCAIRCIPSLFTRTPAAAPSSLAMNVPVLPPVSRPFFSVVAFPSAVRDVWRHQHAMEGNTMEKLGREDICPPSASSLPSLLLCYPNPKGTMLFQYDDDAILTLCRGVYFLQASIMVYDQDQRDALFHTVEQWWRKKQREKESEENVLRSETEGEGSEVERTRSNGGNGKPKLSSMQWMWKLKNGWGTMLEALRFHTFLLQKALEEIHRIHRGDGGLERDPVVGGEGGGSRKESSRSLYSFPSSFPAWRPHLAAISGVPILSSRTPKGPFCTAGETTAPPVVDKNVEGQAILSDVPEPVAESGATSAPLLAASSGDRTCTALSARYSCSGTNPRKKIGEEGEEETPGKWCEWVVREQVSGVDHPGGCCGAISNPETVEVVAFSPQDVLIQQRLDCSRKLLPMMPTDWFPPSSSPSSNAGANSSSFSRTVPERVTTPSGTALSSPPLHENHKPLKYKEERMQSEETTHRGLSDRCSPTPMRSIPGGNRLMPYGSSSSLLKHAEATTVDPPMTFLSFLLESLFDTSVDHLEKVVMHLHSASVKAMLRYQQIRSAAAA